MVFVLDNYDSFTYNLVQYVGELGAQAGAGSSEDGAISSEIGAISSEIVVKRNDEVTPQQVLAMRPARILLSPGPCTPQDAGILVPLIQLLAGLPKREQIPVLGVCLGHQAIGAAFGGDVVRAPQLMHGKTSLVAHDGRTIFRGIPRPMTCTRYHSLMVEESTLPEVLEVSARVLDRGDDEDGANGLGNGLIMGLRHRTLPIEGVQFHPESVLTDHGKQLIANFLKQST